MILEPFQLLSLLSKKLTRQSLSSSVSKTLSVMNFDMKLDGWLRKLLKLILHASCQSFVTNLVGYHSH